LLFLDLAHAISYTDEAVAANVCYIRSIPEMVQMRTVRRKSAVVAGHCYVRAPILMPAVVLDASPTARPVNLVFVSPTLQFEHHPLLDTPPPNI